MNHWNILVMGLKRLMNSWVTWLSSDRGIGSRSVGGIGARVPATIFHISFRPHVSHYIQNRHIQEKRKDKTWELSLNRNVVNFNDVIQPGLFPVAEWHAQSCSLIRTRIETSTRRLKKKIKFKKTKHVIPLNIPIINVLHSDQCFPIISNNSENYN